MASHKRQLSSQLRYQIIRMLVVIISVTILLSHPSVSTTLYDELQEKLTKIQWAIEHIRVCRNIPALSVAIVQKGDTILAQGYGKEDIEKDVDADHNTKFCIGSLTKAFTSTLISLMLENQSSITYDTKVKDILGKDFQMYDELRTDHVTIRDLLAHRVGIPPYFGPLMVGYIKDATLDDVVKSLRYLIPTEPFRAKFLYNNYMYGLAGFVVQHLDNQKSWQDLVREKILLPLGMTSSGFIDTEPEPTHLALPYASVNNTFVRIGTEVASLSVKALSAAGAIYSTADDMGKWIKYHLKTLRTVSDVSKHVMYGEQMATTGFQLNLFRPQFPVDDVVLSYGMGWLHSVYRGYSKVWHTGGIATYSSCLWLFPEKDIGVFISTSGPNTRRKSNGIRTLVSYISDIVLNETPWLDEDSLCTFPVPWAKPDTDQTAPFTDDIDKHSLEIKEVDRFIGVYKSTAFGDIIVYQNETDQTLRFTYGDLGTAILRTNGNISTEFVAEWTGSLWYISHSDGIPDLPEISFTNIKDNAYDVLWMTMNGQGALSYVRESAYQEPDWEQPPSWIKPCSCAEFNMASLLLLSILSFVVLL